MLNIIIGKRSNLSLHLAKKLTNALLVSSQTITREFEQIDFSSFGAINIIFNQFQTAKKLYDISSPLAYVQQSIVTTSEVLDFIQAKEIKINKMIYTSSSSVYGNNTSCLESDEIRPMSLHASLKTANERLVSLYSEKYGIDYTVARIFNMYGGNDAFSIVSKIISAYKNNDTLTLINNGEAIRDFVCIDDVVAAYEIILDISNVPIVNIGSSEGKSLLFIMNYLREQGIALKTQSIERDELKVSICQNSILLSLLGDYSFVKVEEYLCEQLKAHHG